MQSGQVREAVKFSCLCFSLTRFCQKDLSLNRYLWYFPFWPLLLTPQRVHVHPLCAPSLQGSRASPSRSDLPWAAHQELPMSMSWHNSNRQLRSGDLHSLKKVRAVSRDFHEMWPLPPPPNPPRHRSAKSRHPSSLFFCRYKETLISFSPSEGVCSSFACKQQLLAG